MRQEYAVFAMVCSGIGAGLFAGNLISEYWRIFGGYGFLILAWVPAIIEFIKSDLSLSAEEGR